ncbi:MAG TPA: polysaccharide deacetylase family protein, partial [Kribbella sp.]|nr:polysaccharide deacetylase family protein [Kribbella sp.]
MRILGRLDARGRHVLAWTTAVLATGAASIGIAGCAAGDSGQPTAGASPTPAAPTTTPYNSTPASPVPRPAPNPTASAMAGGKKVIFFTFDDGPDPHWTPTILQVLRRYGAHATFFEV